MEEQLGSSLAEAKAEEVLVTLSIKIPQEQIPDLTIELELSEIMSAEKPITVEDLKKRIHEQHPFKPEVGKQRLLFGGKLLENGSTLSSILEKKIQLAREFMDNPDNAQEGGVKGGDKAVETVYEQCKLKFTFHLMIFRRQAAGAANQAAEAADASSVPANDGQGQRINQDAGEQAQEPRQRPDPRQQPRTADQTYMSSKFHKYEKKLIREYLQTLRDVKSYDSHLDHDAQLDTGLHNTSAMHFRSILSGGMFPHNSNLDPKQAMLLSHLPIMSKQFQERLNSHMNERNLTLNAENSRGQPISRHLQNLGQVRFLGYDSMLQLTLLGKLIFFMIVFGMNTDKNYKWITLAFVISYYFWQVREVYVQHYERQRRVIGAVQGGNNQGAEGGRQGREQQRGGQGRPAGAGGENDAGNEQIPHAGGPQREPNAAAGQRGAQQPAQAVGVVEQVRQRVAQNNDANGAQRGNQAQLGAQLILPDYCDFIRSDEQRQHQDWLARRREATEN